jgi:hypothetical protein
MTKMVLTLACAAALLFACAEARAAEQGGTAPGATPEQAAKPKAAEGEGTKTEGGEAAKPEDGAPSAGAESAGAPPPEGDSGPLTLAELTRDGFVIRTTNFIPAEAVTRQSGKVSSDAFIVTLQTATSTAVCFYTLKAYVGKKLTTIPACTVHR